MLACVENNVVYPFQQNYHSIEDEVTFGNLKQYYRYNETIVVEYTLGQKVRATSHDIVGMYPVGWQSLEQFVAFETAIVRPAETYRRQRKVVFQPRHRVDRVQQGVEYMFVYISKDTMQVLGTSHSIMFVPEMLPECQPDGWKGCDEKTMKTGRPLRKAPDTNSLPFFMDSLTVSQQYSTCMMSPPWINPAQYHNMGGNSPLVPVCYHCNSPANYAQTQHNLMAKVRAVTDELHEEQARVSSLERQLELSRAAQSKLRLTAQYAVREKNMALGYLNNVITHLTERGILKVNQQQTPGPNHRPRFCSPPPVVQKVLQLPQDASNHKSLPASLPGILTSRERLLKAFIGSQEATIRELHRRLNEATGETSGTKEPVVQKTQVRLEKIPETSAKASSDNRNIPKTSAKASSDNGNKFAQICKSPKVDTVQAVVIDSQKAQYGDREVLPDSDDSDGNESRNGADGNDSSSSAHSDGASGPK